MKKLKIQNYKILFLGLSIMFLLGTPFLLTAEDLTEYKLLVPIPQLTTDGEQATAKSYLEGIVPLIIAIAGALAVIKIIFGGIQYMSTDAFQGKSDAKSTISNAIWGLVLIISAWLILNTINPNLVNFNFDIEGQKVGERFDSTLATTSPDGIGYSPSYGMPWPLGGGNDSYARAQLKDQGVEVKEPECTTIGQSGCTSVAGINPSVIAGLSRLRSACDCAIVITGGTEYWLHGTKETDPLKNTRTGHRAGGNAVDLRKISAGRLDSFIMSQEKVSGSGCSLLGPGGRGYRYNGITFVNESNHWHVCF